MNRVMVPLFVFACALSATAFAALPEAEPGSVGLDPRALARIDQAVNQAIDDHAVPGAVVLVGRHGKIAYVKAFGRRAIVPEPEPMTRDTIFDMASLTKPVATASAVMLLIEQGKVKLDDLIITHLPEFANHGKEAITVEMLLRHRAGLIPDNPIADYKDGPETAWKHLAELTPRFPPGDRFLYSDVNFLILGRLVERLSGQPLDQFAQAHVFEPAGMADTRFTPGEDLRNRIAPTEPDEPGTMLRGTVHDPRSRALGGVAGHAGLFSTADDLALYAQMLLAGGKAPNGTQVLAPATVASMIDPARTPPHQRRGLGWDVATSYSSPKGERFGPRGFGHTGFTGTSIWVDTDTDTFVILLTSRLHPDGKQSSPTALRSAIATIVAEAVLDQPVGTDVWCGIDVLIRSNFQGLRGKRIGLVTNHTGRSRDGRSTIDVLFKAPEVKLLALFSPEHGIRGAVDRAVNDGRDEATGLPIYSLYGDTRKPRPETLKGLDVLVYDIQDVGARFYTYISTLGLVLEAAREANLGMMVLDRPNPIGGLAVGGPVREDEFASFIAYHALPVRHGMTVGELARMFNAERGLGAELTVVACRGWRRGDLYDRAGLLWVNPSPNMRSLTEALLYPGVGLLEATNLATGRGTDTPFERVGAPYIDPVEFAGALNRLALEGVRFVPVRFTPTERQFANEDCGGVYIQITDRDAFDPIDLGLGMAIVLRRLYRDQWKPEALLRFIGHRSTYEAIVSGGNLQAARKCFGAGLDAFRVRRARALLYPE